MRTAETSRSKSRARPATSHRVAGLSADMLPANPPSGVHRPSARSKATPAPTSTPRTQRRVAPAKPAGDTEAKIPAFHPDLASAQTVKVRNGPRAIPDVCFEVYSRNRLLLGVYTFNHAGWKSCSLELYKRANKHSAKWQPVAAWGHFAKDKQFIEDSPLWVGPEVHLTRRILATRTGDITP